MTETVITTNPVQDKEHSLKCTSAVIVSPGKVELRETGLPEPAHNQVRIRIEGCGLCASNIPTWEGREWFSYPIAAGSPGHEGWGVIDKTGASVYDFKVGDRVTFLSYNAYATHDVALADQVVKIPEFLNELPFPGEPLGCAMNIFHRADIRQGNVVAIVGAGFLGALLIQLCKSAGAKVIAISQRDYSLQVAAEAGADHLIKMDDHYQIISKVSELTGANFCDRVIEVTGKEWPLNLSIEITRERGRLTVAGFHQDGMRQVNMQLLNWRGIDLISAHERDPRQYIQGIRDAITAVEKGQMNPFPLFTHTFSLDQAQTAFEHLAGRPQGFIKALIVNNTNDNSRT